MELSSIKLKEYVMCLIHSWDSFVVLQSPIQVFFRRNGKMFNNIEVVTKICCNISYHEAAPKNLYSTNYVQYVSLSLLMKCYTMFVCISAHYKITRNIINYKVDQTEKALTQTQVFLENVAESFLLRLFQQNLNWHCKQI